MSNVQAGRVERGSTDAVNGGQLWDAQQAWNDRWTDTDRRVRHQDRRINALGAQLGALSQMATAAAANGGGAVGQVNLNMGVGFSGGEAAVSIGWGPVSPSAPAFLPACPSAPGTSRLPGLG